ncbi:nuclear transport factor 2 family protein [Clostridium estertheticum]|uniref:nuclear transport factor 2 family protein n=1 Tax=Clostridium estertheticum TaxID=238834 RepID=UPI001C0BD1B6|nr:nuclear transport factor 2 family protein [Clostridium estertheticum]MBU3201103.1 nuclear transport factor 2 family protein [Clostridium estertheticum]WAG66591.1 nuclear transport factor 2 family protein [Clostridium estertheticum]
MEEKEKIADCYRKIYRYMIKKDITGLGKILDVSFVLMHMTGMNQPKSEFLKYIENSTLNYYSAEHKDISIDIEVDKASVIGKSLVSAAVFGGGKGTWRLQMDIKLIKRENQWLMTETRTSTY